MKQTKLSNRVKIAMIILIIIVGVASIFAADADVRCVDKIVNQVKAEQNCDRNDIDKVFLHYIYNQCGEEMPNYEWTTNLTGKPTVDKKVMHECYNAKIADFHKANGDDAVINWQIEQEFAAFCAIEWDEKNGEPMFGVISQQYIDAEGGE